MILPWLAQQSAASSALNPYAVLGWAAVVLVAMGLLGVIALAVRRRLLRPEAPDAAGSMGFTLAGLREMHAKGQLTDEEFDHAKRRLIANARSRMADDDDGVGPAEVRFGDSDDEDIPF